MLNLDYRDARPIYEQVRDNLRRLMVSGAIQEGEKLPSVRSLASNLAINPTPSSGPMSPWRRRLCLFYPWEGQLRGPAPGWMRSGGTGCWGSSTV